MKSIKRTLFYSWVAAQALFTVAGCQSSASITDAEKAYEKREYFVSADLFKRAYSAESDKLVKADAAYGAAESFYKINDYKNAQRWYNNTLKNSPENLDALFNLASVLKAEESYEEAIEKFNQYKTNGGSAKKADHEIEGCQKAKEWQKENSRYVVINEKALNSRYSDFAAVNVKNREVYFTSDRENRKNKKMYARTGDRYLAIYRAEIKRNRKKTDDQPLKIKGEEIPEGLNFKYNEGTCIFDRSTVYFTLCNGEDGKGTACKIYSARQNGKGFSDIEPLSFCTDTLTNYGHPAIGNDGSTLYFSANLPGGFGGKDIYSSTYDRRSKTWSEPVNLGSTINTDKDELYPFVHKDGTLYFSSNGHVGMGGLDIYSTTKEGANWAKPENMKAPINSGADDFSITVNDDKETGFLSSNREGGRGKDDIYSFYMKPLVFNLTVVVKNAKTQKPVANAIVQFTIGADSTDTLTADSKGELKLPLLAKTAYNFFAAKADEYYLDSKTEGVSTEGKEASEDFTKELLLTPISVEDEFTLKGIYYDLNKADIRTESEPVLDSLITLLNKYPKIVIEIGSHTDCRSSKEYNQTLSQKRAESVVDYLVSKGVNVNRLEAKGYGETRLVNDCECEGTEVKRNCTEEEHQQNRRTTFRIISK